MYFTNLTLISNILHVTWIVFYLPFEMKNDKKKNKKSMWKKKSNITQINRAFVQAQNKFYSAQGGFSNILLVIFWIHFEKKNRYKKNKFHDPSKNKNYLSLLLIYIHKISHASTYDNNSYNTFPWKKYF